MLSGNWKNFDELEDNLSYPELVALVEALRERDQRNMRFQAALQGVDIDKNKPQEEDPVERAKRRVRARMQNRDEEEVRFEEAVGHSFKVIKE